MCLYPLPVVDDNISLIVEVTFSIIHCETIIAKYFMYDCTKKFGRNGMLMYEEF